jgi:hypothetical protein
MAGDAFEPGPDGSYPFFPRRADGSPLWSDSAETDGKQVDGVTPMPRGLRYMTRDGARITVDVTPRNPDGSAINPPTLER